MVNQEHPDGDGQRGASPQGERQAPQAPLAPPVFAGAARRRFTRAGAVGVVLTLKSQPGMAYTCNLASPSAAGSFMITASHAPTMAYCNAKSHGWWKTQGTWPASTFSSPQINLKNELFYKVFPAGSGPYGPGSKFYNAKLFDVIGWGGGGAMDQELPRHMIAVYLNILTGRTTHLTTTKLRQMWAAHVNGGFAPAGVAWTTKQLVNYLVGTFGGTKFP